MFGNRIIANARIDERQERRHFFVGRQGAWDYRGNIL
jgi:hypothetical protein